MLQIENIIEQSLQGKKYVIDPGKNGREYTIYLLENKKKTEYIHVEYDPENKQCYTFTVEGKEEPNQDVCAAAYSMVCDLYQKQCQKKQLRPIIPRQTQ